MRFLIKVALVPLWIIIAMCWLLAAVVSRTYAMTHGFLWAILLVPIIIACLLQMWQNALIFIVVGVVSYMLLFGITLTEVLFEALRKSIAAQLQA